MIKEYKKILKNKELIGTAKVTPLGIAFEGIRYGTEYGSISRGGTWYEIPAFSGAVSAYESGKWHSKKGSFGVGGIKRFERVIILSNPYLFDWTGMGEGLAPIKLAEILVGKTETKKLSKGIMGIHAEKAFSKIEKAIAGSLFNHGYDGVIFYDLATEKGDILHPKQAFVLFQ